MLREPFNHGWGVRPKTSAFFDLAGATSYTPVTLPHDAMIGRERRADLPRGAMNGFFPGGDEEYRKEFEVPDEWRERRAYLEFEGVYRDARVHVNGALVAHHPYGYTGFVVRLDPYLRYGSTNTVRVECTANEDSRWYSGQGIYRPVYLHVGRLVHLGIETLRVTTPEIDDGSAVVEVEETVENESAVTRTLSVETQLLDAEGNVATSDSVPLTVFPGTSATTRRRLYLETVRRWDVDDPYLYAARVIVRSEAGEVDRSETTFGVRELQLDPRHGLRINGRTVKLRGACVHHDNGPVGAATIGRAEERRAGLLKAAGFNALRSAHNPMSKAMLAACDRLGMLVLDEAFDVWTSGKARFDHARDFPTWWEDGIRAMVGKDYNHPSVVMYSIGNEIPETGSALDAPWGRRLAETVRTLDPHRYTVNCVNGLLSVIGELGGFATEGDGINDVIGSMDQIMASDLVTDRTEEAFGQVDIAGYNYRDSRYEMDSSRFPHRVVVGSETGQAHIASNWELVTRLPNVIGDFCWTGWDYLGEVGVGRFDRSEADEETRGFMGSFPYLTAAVGDLDITGTRLPVSYYRETVFGLRDQPYVAVHRPSRFGDEGASGMWGWPDCLGSWTWDGDEGKPVRIEVYSNAEEAELLVNGRSIGVERVGARQAFAATFETVYEPGTITAIARTAGEETGRAELVTATGPLLLRVDGDADSIAHTDDDLAFVRIDLVDHAGTLNTSATCLVSVTVDGSGVLQGPAAGRDPPDRRRHHHGHRDRRRLRAGK
jgi:beta-galactosidase